MERIRDILKNINSDIDKYSRPLLIDGTDALPEVGYEMLSRDDYNDPPKVPGRLNPQSVGSSKLIQVGDDFIIKIGHTLTKAKSDRIYYSYQIVTKEREREEIGLGNMRVDKGVKLFQVCVKRGEGGKVIKSRPISINGERAFHKLKGLLKVGVTKESFMKAFNG